ncbi:hypothetical protein GCK72_001297 [Caenorhabditis remanei]|uniref:F-box domain-containing protein n=1 Tax=Caenorhabditis remanei TaxID=31234 RepID=A0A6A5HML9_CAERE|nr:hypothetical protein GCK72_001297 [Caenorhabditis remanei]KAF1769480.1 hypothetical protein GCK72_001297 [Caenorhabditis remanei]
MAIEEPMDVEEDVAGWKHLPPEIRINIIARLRFFEKQNMMLVNWDSYDICATLPNKLHELGITEFPSTAKTMLIMKWKNDAGRVVSRMVEFRGTSLRQTECPEHTADAMRAFLRIWRLSKIKSVIIEIPCFEGLAGIWDEMMAGFRTSIAVRSFNIRTNDYRLVTKALTATKNRGQDISLLANDHGGMETAVFDIDKVKNARSVILWSLISNIQDHQLLALTAHNIRLHSDFITSNCIAKMIQEWKDGKRSLERLHITSPLIDLDAVVRQVNGVCWKNMTDICSIIWREVDEEGYSFATRGPTYDIPAAIGLIPGQDGTPTFIFRIIRMTHEMSRVVYERCSVQCPNMVSSEDMARKQKQQHA